MTTETTTISTVEHTSGLAVFSKKSIRETLKTQGFSGKQLTTEYYRVLRGMQTGAAAQVDVLRTQEGYLIESTRETKGGKFIVTLAPPAAEVQAQLQGEKYAQLMRLCKEHGIDVETMLKDQEIKALKAA